MSGEIVRSSSSQAEIASGVEQNLQFSLTSDVARFAKDTLYFEIFFTGQEVHKLSDLRDALLRQWVSEDGAT